MISAVEDARRMWNPALGAMLLWKFAEAYASHAEQQVEVPFLLMFLALPVALHEETAEIAKSTNRPSGLRKFVGKFTSSSDSRRDELISLHLRCHRLRSLTMESLGVATRAEMLRVDFVKGVVVANGWKGEKDVPQGLRPMLGAVDRLGCWCSSLSPAEVSATLKVAF